MSNFFVFICTSLYLCCFTSASAIKISLECRPKCVAAPIVHSYPGEPNTIWKFEILSIEIFKEKLLSPLKPSDPNFQHTSIRAQSASASHSGSKTKIIKLEDFLKNANQDGTSDIHIVIHCDNRAEYIEGDKKSVICSIGESLSIMLYNPICKNGSVDTWVVGEIIGYKTNKETNDPQNQTAIASLPPQANRIVLGSLPGVAVNS